MMQTPKEESRTEYENILYLERPAVTSVCNQGKAAKGDSMGDGDIKYLLCWVVLLRTRRQER